MITGVPIYESWPQTIGDTMDFWFLVDFIFLHFHFPPGTCYLQVGGTEMIVLALLDAKPRPLYYITSHPAERADMHSLGKQA